MTLQIFTMSSETRKDYERFLVGNINELIPTTQLATKRQVLKYLLLKKHKAQKENNNFSPALSPLLCCPLKSGSTEASCGAMNGCTEEDMCVVRSVKQAWVSAGFLTILDDSIMYCMTFELRLDFQTGLKEIRKKLSHFNILL